MNEPIKVEPRRMPRATNVGGRAKLGYCRHCRVYFVKKFGHTHKEDRDAD